MTAICLLTVITRMEATCVHANKAMRTRQMEPSAVSNINRR